MKKRFPPILKYISVNSHSKDTKNNIISIIHCYKSNSKGTHIPTIFFPKK